MLIFTILSNKTVGTDPPTCSLKYSMK